MIAHKILVLLALNQPFKNNSVQKGKKIFSLLVQLHIEYKPLTASNKCLQISKEVLQTSSLSSQGKKQNYGVSYFKNTLNHVYFHIKKEKVVFNCFAYV